jgi:hypothetical protein
MTYQIVEELRDELVWQGECFQKQQPYTNCVGHLERAADTIERLCEALEGVCQEADRIRQLSIVDAFTDGMKEGASRLRSLATTALAEAGVEK